MFTLHFKSDSIVSNNSETGLSGALSCNVFIVFTYSSGSK